LSTLSVVLREKGACEVEHQQSGATITTDTPPEFGGRGRSFSATDLLAAALGACVATNLDSICIRHGIPLDAMTITVEKTLSQNPKRVSSLHMTVTFNIALEPNVLQRLESAARDCAVKRSLHPSMQITTRFIQTVGEPLNARAPK
jgi:uncharacterized OsmC-like protein